VEVDDTELLVDMVRSGAVASRGRSPRSLCAGGV